MSRSPDRVVDRKRAEAQRLREQGLSYREIAARMDISHSTANEYCNLGVAERNNRRRARHYRQSPHHQEATKERLRRRRAREASGTDC